MKGQRMWEFKHAQIKGEVCTLTSSCCGNSTAINTGRLFFRCRTAVNLFQKPFLKSAPMQSWCKSVQQPCHTTHLQHVGELSQPYSLLSPRLVSPLRACNVVREVWGSFGNDILIECNERPNAHMYALIFDITWVLKYRFPVTVHEQSPHGLQE